MTDPDRDDEIVENLRGGFFRRFTKGPPPTHGWTRFVMLRFLGLVYLVAFVSLYRQLLPLLGSRGLLPIPQFLEAVGRHFGSPGAGFARLPTMFWIGASDDVLVAACAVGVILSLLLLAGATNAVLQLALWALYLSFVQVGQIFYGYGWETLLLEAGFLSIFLCPVRSVHPFPRASPPPAAVIWLFRWLAFRIMVGAGLIKLRGDPCWRDLTCLVYHYETQPNPNPLSYYLHQLPPWFHAGGVLINHVVELVVPWMMVGPRRARSVAGALLVGFQVFLIVSGNLSFLNWLTLAICLSCFDDEALGRLVPRALRARFDHWSQRGAAAPRSRLQRGVIYALVGVVALLSLNPIVNMLSPRQAMNASFEPLHLVNTYGAFGSVGRQRYEVILEGTRSETVDEQTTWLEYELPCKPGDVNRRPCVITPYHYRLDWQLWFAAMSRIESEPWLVHLVYKLLRGDPGVTRLFARDPFRDGPPRFIRLELYRYEFTRAGEEGGAWWRRTPLGIYLRPVSLEDDELLDYVAARGWLEE